jgi:ELP3 family radical SAM enzyme/protein acetyltransferase
MKIVDIEDLETKNSSCNKVFIDKELINFHFNEYKQILYQLFNFYKENYQKDNFKHLFDTLYNKLSRRRDKLVVKKVYLVFIYRKEIASNQIENDQMFWALIQKCPARNLSGVNSFAILLAPHPTSTQNGKTKIQKFSCKHNCYYCPDETIANGSNADMPRSYLQKEPAVARGFKSNWDAITQMNTRMNSLLEQGHVVDKLELIIEGGTYTEYPKLYLQEFHRDIFYSANTFFDNENTKRDKMSLNDEMQINVNSKVRIIGICIETRPDAIEKDWIYFLRACGVTRIQLGVQHTNDTILKGINRGHTFQQSKNAMKLLKDNCFKVDIHLMPDLPNSTPEIDKEMFDEIYRPEKNESYQPDQIKIYPCEITPFTIISKWYSNGLYKPYSETIPGALDNVVAYGMEHCPPWIRLPRVVRDIPLSYIISGNKKTNLRQIIENDILTKTGKISKDLRSREIGRNKDYKFEDGKFFVRQYSNGHDYFISMESWDQKALFGFIRLRINENDDNVIFPELVGRGLIRELHVYNTLVCVGNKSNENASQHRGLGKKLVSFAENISRARGKSGMAVISGEGVKGYYYKLGYKQPTNTHFLLKDFNKDFFSVFNLTFIILVVLCIPYFY